MTQIDPFDDWVEAYINSLHWSFGTSDYEKTLVAGNLRGMAAWINANLLKPAMEPRIVYVVGGMQPDGTWGCGGVFSTEEQACRCCIDHDNYFVGPIMGDTFHEADDDWPESFYPAEGKLYD